MNLRRPLPPLSQRSERVRFWPVAAVLVGLAGLAIAAARTKPAEPAKSGVLVGSFAGHDWIHYDQGPSDHTIRLDSIVAILGSEGGRQVFYFGGGKLASDLPKGEFDRAMTAYQKKLDAGEPIPSMIPQIIASRKPDKK